ncbi:MAG: hypothetical protein ACYS8W_13340 [Planctomycetota bacterium]|jgi:hypothetical protein
MSRIIKAIKNVFGIMLAALLMTLPVLGQGPPPPPPPPPETSIPIKMLKIGAAIGVFLAVVIFLLAIQSQRLKKRGKQAQTGQLK